MVRSRKNRRVATRDRHGQPNGFVVPIFNVADGFVEPAQHPQQVYLTVVGPRQTKGPHLHLKRWGLFTCIKGNVKIVVRDGDRYRSFLTGEQHDYATIQVPAGAPSAIVNLGDEEAFVLNMPAPPWRADDPDDHPVSFPEDVLK